MLNFIARGKELGNIWSEAETGRKVYPKEWIEGEIYTGLNDVKYMKHVIHKVRSSEIFLTPISPDTICWKCPETDYWTNDVLKVTIDDGDCLQKWIVPVKFSEGCFLVDIEYNDFMGIPIHHLELHGFTVEKIGNMIDNPEIFEPHKP